MTARNAAGEAAPLSPASPPPASPLDELRAAPKVTIRIHKTGVKGEPRDVYVGVNGVGYQIQRGVDVAVPEPVAKVLETAIQTVYDYDEDAQALIPREAQAYPFTYLR